MKILELEVEGYRSLKKAKWEPGDLNVVIGPNAGGKTNILRVLELLSVAARGGLGDFVKREGGMEPLLWDGSADAIKMRVMTSPLGRQQDQSEVELIYNLELSRLGQSSAYTIDSELLLHIYSDELSAFKVKEGDDSVMMLERNQNRARIFGTKKSQMIQLEEHVSEDETLLSLMRGPWSSVNLFVSNYQRELTSWGIYQDIHTNRVAPIRKPALTRPEKRVTSDAQNLISVLHTLYTGSREFKTEVNAAMKAAFGSEFEELVFPPAADSQIQLRVRWKSLKREQSAADLSDGTLRFLFLLTVLGNPEPPSLIAIDEPEIGLHPSMFPIIAEFAAEASKRTQVVLTTHSPDFLSAFSDSVPTTTVVEWRDGKTEFRVLSGNELDYWLKQYSLGELFRSGELDEME